MARLYKVPFISGTFTSSMGITWRTVRKSDYNFTFTYGKSWRRLQEKMHSPFSSLSKMLNLEVAIHIGKCETQVGTWLRMASWNTVEFTREPHKVASSEVHCEQSEKWQQTTLFASIKAFVYVSGPLTCKVRVCLCHKQSTRSVNTILYKRACHTQNPGSNTNRRTALA